MRKDKSGNRKTKLRSDLKFQITQNSHPRKVARWLARKLIDTTEQPKAK